MDQITDSEFFRIRRVLMDVLPESVTILHRKPVASEVLTAVLKELKIEVVPGRID